MNPDIIVLGAGFSGLMAAYRAAEQGAKVLLLSKGVGTTHWASGSIDVLGYHPVGAAESVMAPVPAMQQLIADEPDHPYAHIDLDTLRAALQALQKVAAAQGLNYVGGLEGNFLLPTPAGALRPTCLAPESMAKGDVRRGGSMLILGFNRIRDFYPEIMAANLTVQGIQARGVGLAVPEVDRHKTMTTVILARMLEDAPVRRQAIQAAKAALGKEERVGFPAVLGFQRHAEVIADFERALGVPVFEIPTLPPSASGFRLFEAFRHALLQRGVRIVIGSQGVRAETADGRVIAVETEASARLVRHSAPRYVLATGGIAGGGIRAEYKSAPKEMVFDLPVAAPEDRKDWFNAKFLAPGGQPIFRAGVMVNDNLQPVDRAGAVVYENVRAAGSTLAHWDAWRELSHEGVCLSTAWKAAAA